MNEPTNPAASPPEGIDYGRIVVQLGIMASVLAVGAGAIGYGLAGGKGLAGALLGAVIVGAFFGVSAWVMHRSKTPEAKARNLLLTWFAKLVILFVVMLALNQATFINRPAFGVTILVGIIGSLILEGRVVWSARLPPTMGDRPT